MSQDTDKELYIVCTDRIVLECRCGGSLVLLGQEEDWYKEGRTAFECRECGRHLTLASQSNEGQGPALVGGTGAEDMNVRELIRNLRAAEGR